MDYVIIRRYGDHRADEHADWTSHGPTFDVVGDAWQVEGDELTWKVTKVTAGGATGPAAIVLEPIDE